MVATRRLTIMGSGETTATMVTVHQRTVAALGPSATGVVLDSPYGFQENADELTERTRVYFSDRVGFDLDVASLRRADLGPIDRERGLLRLNAADLVFAGPGSPSYALEVWHEVGVRDALLRRLRRGGAVTFASAAACTLGAVAIPVYEIYKVGEPPRWIEGLDLMRVLDLDVAVVPHFDNAEGGTHDTRFCYVGERRLALLEEQVADSTAVLGIDEHTAAAFDLDADEVTVSGRGGLTVRADGETRLVVRDTTVPVDDLRKAAQRHRASRPTPTGRPAAAGPDLADLERRFESALDRGDGLAATAIVLEVERLLDRDDRTAVRAALRRLLTALGEVAHAGLHDHRDLVAPYVEALVDLRDEARAQRDYAAADAIRDRLATRGIDLRDSSDGTDWTYPDG